MDELELYQQMMSKDPSSQIYVYLAEALLEHEMYKEAIETCVNGLRLRPHDLRARVILGVSLLRTGELDRAESELLKAKEMLEINAVTYRSLAELYEKKGDFETAGLYRRLFEAINPTEEEAIESEEEGEEVPAEEVRRSAIAMAQLHEEQGHLKEAAEVYEEIFDASPETESVEEELADIERPVDQGQVKRTLLSVLELLQKNMQAKLGAEKPSPSSEQSGINPSGINPENLAAFVKPYMQGSHPS